MKRTMIAVALAATLMTGVAGEVWAGSGAGAINLSFPVGARFYALGEAGTALSQDVTAMWWNPGGLAFLPQRPQQRDASSGPGVDRGQVADDGRLADAALARGHGDDVADVLRRVARRAGGTRSSR